MHLTLRSLAHKVFGVQLYKYNARALLSPILDILNSDWLQHVHSVRGVYEFTVMSNLSVYCAKLCFPACNFSHLFSCHAFTTCALDFNLHVDCRHAVMNFALVHVTNLPM